MRLRLLRPILLGIFALPLLASFFSYVEAAKPYIANTVEYGVNTECKTCPHSLCTNKLYYDSSAPVNLTCWTTGTLIASNNLWLGTSDGCYVTQYDISLYNGSYQADLDYCGPSSQDESLTTVDAKTQYKTECNIIPQIDGETVSYLAEDTDLTVTCWTTQGSKVIDDDVWVKTTNNCYVPEIQLYEKVDQTYMDNCGPIPFLEIQYHNNPNVTTEVDRRAAIPEPIDDGKTGAKYLINVTVGEDYAHCRECASESCDLVMTYPFNSEVWLQCLVEVDVGTNVTWWSETIDFCYVNNAEFWQDPSGDYYNWPLCSDFPESNS